MKSIIKSLYMNDIDISNNSFPKDPEYRDINHQISDIIVKFTENLSEKDKKLFDNLNDLQSKRNSFDNVESFKSGFCIGVLMMIDVMNSNELNMCDD